MARKGPVTKDTSSIVLGLAQVRVGASAANITSVTRVLTSTNSLGALANTKFTGNVDWWKLESGFPLLEDYQIPIREAAHLECAFKEISPVNMALAYGKDISAAPYSSYTTHSGELALGMRDASSYVRMEAFYTYPNGTQYMTILFPRAQVSAAVEMDLATEDAAAVPITIESKRADSDMSGGDAAWDSRPLGRIFWD
jgi:hypothetical protein